MSDHHETIQRWLPVINTAGAVIVFVTGAMGGRWTVAEEQQAAQQAHVTTVSSATAAVRDTMRDELAPVRADLDRLAGGVDTLSRRIGTVEGRVGVLEVLPMPAAPTPTTRGR